MSNGYEVINFKHHKIYKIKVDGVDNSKLLKEIDTDRRYLVGDLSFNPIGSMVPGIQFGINTSYGELISDIKTKCYNIVKELYTSITNKKVNSGYQNCWVYISSPQNPVSVYHQHAVFYNEFPKLTSSFTWVYYIDMPDNCVGNEGKLIFKNHKDDDDEKDTCMIMPEAGYIYIFGGTLWHRPEINPNSTNDRVVIASNVVFNTQSDSSNII